jgi:hypothetical protein
MKFQVFVILKITNKGIEQILLFIFNTSVYVISFIVLATINILQILTVPQNQKNWTA